MIRQLMIDYVTTTGTVDPATFHTVDWSLTSNGTPDHDHGVTGRPALTNLLS